MITQTDRMRELIKILNGASKAYYQENRELMPDREYDRLYDELVELENSTGVILTGSPTRNVGFTVLSNLEKVKHDYPMLSLDKTKNISKLISFINNNECLLSWKLDGLAINLKYKNGTLVQAITRGNGVIGEDITHNAVVFSNIPVRISRTEDIQIRGEAVISFSEFKRINEKLEDTEKYKNPRNLCSGTVRQLNSEIASGRNVSFYAYALLSPDIENTIDLKSERFAFMRSMGFDVVESCIVTESNIEDEVRRFEQKISGNDFASDGLVLTYNSASYGNSLGSTSKFPRDSIAFKWADENAETTLLEIKWNTSRTGLINPVAVFEPVELEGSTVNRASLHNISILKSLKLGVGDRITVYKANMIIPQVSGNLTCSDSAEIPGECPECGCETEIRSLREGSALYCTNPNCMAQLVRSLTHFTSRDAMNIEGFSVSTIEKFVEKGFISDYTDIFSLVEYSDEIKQMDGFGEKSLANLVASIEKSKNVAVPNFIYALGINNVGLANSKLLCEHYGYDLDNIISADTAEMEQIEGFGEIISNSLHSYFTNERNLVLLKKAIEHIKLIKPDIVLSDEIKPLEGKVFVITGDLELFKNRNELRQKIESLGGKVTGSVSSKTSFLVNNDKTSRSSKNQKAEELHVPVISEEQLDSMMKG